MSDLLLQRAACAKQLLLMYLEREGGQSPSSPLLLGAEVGEQQ